jgi:hypothetical protein
MVEAKDIIPRGWIKVEALRLSKLAVKQEIRDLGLKLSEFSAKENHFAGREMVRRASGRVDWSSHDRAFIRSKECL